MPHLTKRLVDATPAGQGQRFIWDDEAKGFGLLVLPSGLKSFVVQYRNADGRSRRLTIGRYGTFTVDQARKEAQAVLVSVAKGGDPVHDRKARKAAPDVNALIDRYLREHVAVHNAERTRAEVRRVVERNIRPALGHLKTGAVTSGDVAKLHGDLGSTPRLANHVLSIVSKIFNLAEIWHLRPAYSNPVRGIRRYDEVKRDRALNADELQRLGQVLAMALDDGLPWIITAEDSKHLPKNVESYRTLPSRTAIYTILLLLFTGARLSEMLTTEWRHFDKAAGTLALPGRKGKERKPHPIGAATIDLIEDLERRGKWLLPRDADPDRHMSKEVVETTWQKVRYHAGLKDVRLHDLRHTAGTIAGQTGSAFLVMHLLRHRNVVTTTRYVNTDADPIREIFDRVGDVLTAGLDPTGTGLKSRKG